MSESIQYDTTEIDANDLPFPADSTEAIFAGKMKGIYGTSDGSRFFTFLVEKKEEAHQLSLLFSHQTQFQMKIFLPLQVTQKVPQKYGFMECSGKIIEYNWKPGAQIRFKVEIDVLALKTLSDHLFNLKYEIKILLSGIQSSFL